MKRCKKCDAPLAQEGILKHNTDGRYVSRVCKCGREHRTWFNKPPQPPVEMKHRTMGYVIYLWTPLVAIALTA